MSAALVLGSQSCESTFHRITDCPLPRAASTTASLHAPSGGRNKVGLPTPAPTMTSSVSANHLPSSVGESVCSCLCRQLSEPMSLPCAAMVASNCLLLPETNWPCTKNVAGASACWSAPSSCGVTCLFGPSSKVSATHAANSQSSGMAPTTASVAVASAPSASLTCGFVAVEPGSSIALAVEIRAFSSARRGSLALFAERSYAAFATVSCFCSSPRRSELRAPSTSRRSVSASVCTSRMRLTMLVLAAPNLRASSLRSLVLWLVSQDDVVSVETVCVSSMCSILFASAVACSSLIVLPSPCASLDAFDSVVVYVVLSVPNSRCADSQSASAVACSPCWRRWDALTIGMTTAASNPAMASSATMTASAVLRRRCGGVSASPVNSALKRSRLSIGVFGRIVSHVAPHPAFQLYR